MSESSHRNVVHFDRHGKSGHASKLIAECRNMASESLANSLSTMMGLVDDALFELAEKAENNVEQSHYFDAMRDVRLKRKEIEDEFRKQLIERCGLGAPSSMEQSDLSINNELSLIEDNLLETTLAVSNMVAKANYLCKDELFALEQRIIHLLHRNSTDKFSNPLDPINICNAFKDACNPLDSDIKVKLIILKLFEKYVIKDLKAIYQEVNQFLAQNNVLPVINYAIRNNAAVETTLDQVLAEIGDEGDTAGGDLFTSLQNLIKTNSTSPGTGIAGSPVSADEILNNLTMLQQGNPNNAFSGELRLDPVQLTSGTSNVLRELKTHNVFGKMSRQEDYTIDIVAMLFDYILDDKNISDRMKAIIGRLQIPVLKVVMMDRTFFSRKRHPARSLLDALSRAAIGLDDGEDEFSDAIYEKAEEIVQKILNDFNDDIEIFEVLLTDLEEFLADISRQSEEQIEQTRQEFEQQALHHNAGIIANKEVRARIDISDISPVVKEFLGEYWSRLLMLSYLQSSGDEASLQVHIDTMDQLIWSVLPKKNQDERRSLVDELPGLLERLNQGMDSLAMAEAERDAFFSKLARCHSKAVSTKSQQENETAPAPEQNTAAVVAGTDGHAKPSTESNPAADNPAGEPIAGDTTIDTTLNDSESEAPSSRASDILAQFEQGKIEVEEITLSNSVEEKSPAPVEDEYTEMVKNIAKGTWVSFTSGDGTTTHEKLLWINAVTDMYMFANRNGNNTRNQSLYQFAEELRAGRAEILEEDELVDRAVNNIVFSLKSA